MLAVCAVRPIKRVWSSAARPSSREAYARALEKELGIEVRAAPRRKPAWARRTSWSPSPSRPSRCFAPIGSTKGTHVNAAGANSGDRREVDAETVLRAAVKVTDHVEQAKVEAGEFRDLVAAGKLAWSDIRELGELVTGKARGRTSPSDLTLFKSLGIALEDVAFGELVYQRALAAGVGQTDAD